jgi:hypothetical protein
MARETRARTVERTVDEDRDPRNVRNDVQEVWESGRDVWDGGCRLFSNLVIGVGEALAPPSYYYRRRVERDYDDGGSVKTTTTVRKETE